MIYAVVGGIFLVLLLGGFGLARSQGAASNEAKHVKANAKTRKKVAAVPRKSKSSTVDRMRERGKRRTPKS